MIPTQSCPRCGGPLAARLCPKCGPIGAPWQHDPRRQTQALRIVGIFGLTVIILVAASALLAYRVTAKRNQWRAAHPYQVSFSSPVAGLDQLKGNGRIYLVQMGPHTTPYSLDDFAAWLKSKYKLDVQVLPPTALDPAAWDESRKQYIAEMLYAQLKREHPDLAANPNAYLYGVTDADMYSVQYFWNFTFTMRDGRRAAVISAARMKASPSEKLGVGEKFAKEQLQQRLRRILLKDVAVQYWQLPLNNDPSSLLHQTLDPDLPTEDIRVSDLDPEHTPYGRPEAEPCVFLRYSAKSGIRPAPGRLIQPCWHLDKDTPDPLDETFEFALGYGILTDRSFDFYLPDSVPIEFERVTRDGWKGPMGFGISGSHNYDSFLKSTDMVVIEVVNGDGSRFPLQRRPNLPLPLAALKYVDTTYSGKMYEMRWYGSPSERFELRKFNGDVQTFLPCDNNVICYQNGFRNAAGQQLTFERDERRRLMRITSPGKQWIAFTYGPGNHIIEISDSQGRKVDYGYDQRNRLVRVDYPSGEVHLYEYDGQQHLLSFSVASDTKAKPRVMLRNTWAGDLLSTQTLADGSVYQYSLQGSQGDIRSAALSTPDGQRFQMRMTDEGAIIWERSGADKTAKPTFTADANRHGKR